MWDKKGENLTYKFLRLLREEKTPKPKALVIGDSQAGWTGLALENGLKASGFDAIRIKQNGASEAALLQIAKTRDIKPENFDVIYVFAGGNGTRGSLKKGEPVKYDGASIKNLLEFLSRAKRLVWVGPPPATIINNVDAMKFNFKAMLKGVPRGLKVDNQFWFNSGTAARREEKNKIIKDIINGSGKQNVVYYDVRPFYNSNTKMGDGIHIGKNDAGPIASDLLKYSKGIEAGGTQATTATAKGPEKSKQAFTGERLDTEKLRSMKPEQVVEYARARSSACRGMGYLSIGSEGKDTKQVQDRLKELKQQITGPDGKVAQDKPGVFGAVTLMNIINFQIKAGIRVDGCVGPETMGALGGGGTSIKIGGKPFSGKSGNLFKTVSSNFVDKNFNIRPAELREYAVPRKIEVARRLVEVSKQQGFDPVVILSIAWIESNRSLNPKKNMNSKRVYKGLFQFGSQFKKDWARYGLNWKRGDQYGIESAAVPFIKILKAKLKTYFPEVEDYKNIPVEIQYFLYTMWQQGSGPAVRNALAAGGDNRFKKRNQYEGAVNNWHGYYPKAANMKLEDTATKKVISMRGKSRTKMAREFNLAREAAGITARLNKGSVSSLIAQQTFKNQIITPSDYLRRWDNVYSRVRAKVLTAYGSMLPQQNTQQVAMGPTAKAATQAVSG